MSDPLVSSHIGVVQANAWAVSVSLSSHELPVINNNVDWDVAQNGWAVPVNAFVADLQALATISNAFVAALSTVLNAAYESARFDPMWNLMTSLTATPLTNVPAFASFLTTTQGYAASIDAGAKAAGITGDQRQTTLDAYPALTTAAANAAGFLKDYKAALGEDIAALLLWAGRDLSGDAPLPQILREYKEQGTSDYTIAATMFTQLAAVNFKVTSS